MNSDFNNYFASRGVSPDYYENNRLPAYYEQILPANKHASILDFGCGFGQIMRALQSRGYTNVKGYDIEPAAVNHCRSSGLDVSVSQPKNDRFDLIILSHVLEHIDKKQIISQLRTIKSMLNNGGALFLCVPNAQSNTGCYWAYEDFTHNTLFTAGSLLYVLQQAEFEPIEFIDVDCVSGVSLLKKLAKKILLYMYISNFRFWNKVTNSSFHSPSPQIFSYEIKALAYN